MIGHDQRNSVVRVHLTAQLSQTLPHPKYRLARCASERQDHFRSDDLDLTVKIWDAGRDFIGQRLSVLGRSAFDDVGDVHRFAKNLNGLENSVQQISGLPHEGTPLRVFGGTGTLTTEKE